MNDHGPVVSLEKSCSKWQGVVWYLNEFLLQMVQFSASVLTLFN